MVTWLKNLLDYLTAEKKVILVFAFTSIFSAIIAAFFLYRSFYQNVTEAFLDHQLRLTSAMAHEINREMQQSADRLPFLVGLDEIKTLRHGKRAGNPMVPEAFETGKRKILKSFIDTSTSLSAVYLLHKDASFYLIEPYSVQQNITKYNLNDRKYVTEAAKSAKPVISNAFTGADGQPAVAAAYAMRNSANKITGYIGIVYHLNKIDHYLHHYKRPDKTNYYLVDNAGTLIAHTENKEYNLDDRKKYATHPLVKKYLTFANKNSDQIFSASKEYYDHFAKEMQIGSIFALENGWAFIAVSSVSPIKKRVFRTAIGSAAKILILLLSIAVIGVFTAHIFGKHWHLYETNLRDSEKQFREMYQNHSAIMLLIDPADGTIIDANSAASSFYGYSIEELKKLKISDINTASKDEIALQMKRAREKNINYFIFKHKLHNGLVRDVEVHSTPIEIGAGKILFSIIHDITARKSFEKALRERSEQLARLNSELENKVQKEIHQRSENEQLLVQQSKLAAMGEMLGAIAHQWRQPLNALALIIQDIEDAESYGELNHEYIEKAVKNSMSQIQYMSKTIDDFRNFFKPSKEKTVFDLRNAIHEVIEILSAQLTSHGIQAFLLAGSDNNESEHYRIEGYPNEFKQAMVNLVNNAKDAIDERKSKLPLEDQYRGTIEVSLQVSDKHVQIKIKDNGNGIPDELRDRIFEPYFSTKANNKGTGIGLYMTRVIIESNMNGTISLGNPEIGAEFIITLNQAKNLP